MQFVFAPIWGRLSDRVGRRPVLLISIAMTAVAFLLYGVAATFAVLLVSRLFAGAATANIAIAQAYVADVTTPEGRAKGMGMIGAAFGLGFVFGPAVGGLLAGYSLAAPGLAAAALSLVNLVGAFFLLPEPRAARGRHPVRAAASRRSSASSGSPASAGSSSSTSSSPSPSAPWRPPTPSWPSATTGSPSAHVGWVFAYIGVIVVLVQGGLIGPLTRRFGEKRLLVAGALLQGAGAGRAALRQRRRRAAPRHRAAGPRVGAHRARALVAPLQAQPGRGPGRHARHRPVGVGAGADRRPALRDHLLLGLARRPVPGGRRAHGHGRRRGRHRLRPEERRRARPGRGAGRVMR